MKENQLISVCILNYNDSDRIICLINKLLSFSLINMIVVVDNNSTKVELDKLNAGLNGKANVVILKLTKNEGFARGYNVGLRYLTTQKNEKFILQINSDVDFDEYTLNMCLKFLINNPNYISCSPCCYLYDKLEKNGWQFPTLKDLIIHQLKLAFYIGKDKNNDTVFFKNSDNSVIDVDAIRGSFQLFKSDYLRKIDFYNPKTFLYYEENLLYLKSKKNGYKTAILNNCFYYHNHISKYFIGVKQALKQRKIDYKSSLIYLKETEMYSNLLLINYSIIFNLMTPVFFLKKCLNKIAKRRMK